MQAGEECVDPCSPAKAPMLAQLAANAVQRAGSALPEDSIEELWVYQANDEGYPLPDGNEEWICGEDCVRYRWVDFRGRLPLRQRLLALLVDQRLRQPTP